MPSVILDSVPTEEIPTSVKQVDMEMKEEHRSDEEETKEEEDANEEIEKELKQEEDEDSEEASRTKKKLKLDDSMTKKEPENETKPVKPAKTAPTKCEICRQLLDDPDLLLYEGHPNNSVEEFVALTDPKLALFTGEEEAFNEHDERPQNKITHFSVYDKNGHLCPFDSGLIEKNVLLYFSGYVKAIYEEAPEPDGGIPTYDLGPINEWWVSGYDGGEKALIGFSTAFGEYYLMEPSEAYAPVMKSVNEKIYMGKLVIDFLLDEDNPSYEDLLNKLSMTVPPRGLSALTEECLLRHAQFICDQVMSFDSAAASYEQLLITTSCMRSLVKLAGVTFTRRRAMRRGDKKEIRKKEKAKWSKATTTALVANVFEMFFTDQLDKGNDKEGAQGPRRRRCGICEACQLPDCGTCVSCRDLIKFGGSGRSKQCCIQRRCPNMAIQEADDSEPEEDDIAEDSSSNMSWSHAPRNVKAKSVDKKAIEWIGESIKEDSRKTYYKSAKIGGIEYYLNDCVIVEPNNPSIPVYIGRIIYMWQDNKTKEKWFHTNWFTRGSDTVLGEASDPQELFLQDECEDCLLASLTGKANVTLLTMPPDWSLKGGEALDSNIVGPDDGKTFFYQKRYDGIHARFEDIGEDPICQKEDALHRFCPSCERIFLEQKKETPTVSESLESPENSKEVFYGVVKWRDEEYRVGSCVYISPGAFKFKKFDTSKDRRDSRKDSKVDEDMYPEYYRKSSDHIKGSNILTPEPFCIGRISAIVTRSQDKLVAARDICLKVTKFYRPENTHKGQSLSRQVSLQLLYWSREEQTINFGDIAGKCYIICSDNIKEDPCDWVKQGPNRFYFSQAYDCENQKFYDPPIEAATIGMQGKGKGKGKGKSSKREEKVPDYKLTEWPQIPRPLHALDVFAGCGGLSEGLHQSGVAESWWAVEKEEPAAHAFRLNNPNCTVFTEDCNALLRLAMNGEKKNDKGQNLPLKGEVELICGGPPCQGFSGMNRFNSRQYSLFKNSLIVSYLSYCDYYRPKFFILENVRNFVSFKRSMVLKLTMRCLLRMGYQCTFGILQAGTYGVPQTRRRAIILAAAPGEKLPLYPEPRHVFNPRACTLSVTVDDKKFNSNCRWTESAPLRTITVWDAMSDLPEIRNGANCDEMSYSIDPLSHFQRMVRGHEQPLLRDHICKDMAAMVEARIAQIPTCEGSDWRDLPNIVVRLPDGTYSKKLQYTHHDNKNGKSSTGALRGVCSCASGKSCDPMDRQFNTLIPWCLPHTGNRHNHWAGLYGRLEWNGFFSTTVTNPEPMGKQGRVLHPEQTRVVSVRECARSQGFPDSYRFFGSILDKHRQIGNAVPPPMGAAIGYEIRLCIAAAEKKNKIKVEEKAILANGTTTENTNKMSNVAKMEDEMNGSPNSSSKVKSGEKMDVVNENLVGRKEKITNGQPSDVIMNGN